MIVGVHLKGIVGAGLAHSVVGLLIVVPAYAYVIKASGQVGTGWIARSLLPPLGAAIIAGIVAHLVSIPIHTPIVAILAGTAAGAAIYGLLLLRWLRALVISLRALYGKRTAEGLAEIHLHPAVVEMAHPQRHAELGTDLTDLFER
jgi:lipopolysaccharide exporter